MVDNRILTIVFTAFLNFRNVDLLDTCFYNNYMSAPSFSFLAEIYDLAWNISTECTGTYLKKVNEHTCCINIEKLRSRSNRPSYGDADLGHRAAKLFIPSMEEDKHGVSGIRSIDLSGKLKLENITNDCGDECCPENLIRDWPKCHDNSTYYLLEPKCDRTLLEREDSGKCAQSSGNCHLGYCCSPIVNDGKDLRIGVKPYVTAMGCSSKCTIPIEMIFAFCDPETKKISYFGKQKSYSEEASGISKIGQECEINLNCRMGFVCVNTVDIDGRPIRGCLPNPMKSISTIHNSRFTIPMIAICFLLLLIYIQLKALYS